MGDKKPFFYRIDAADFFTMVSEFESEKELGRYIKKLATEMITRKPTSSYAEKIITEAAEYIEKRKKAGAKGGKQKSSNAKATLEQCNDFASSKSVANSSSSSNTIKPLSSSSSTTEEISTPLPMPGGFRMTTKKMDVFEFRSLYQQTFNAMMPGALNHRMHELCNMYPRDVLTSAFVTTAENGGRSLRYLEEVIRGSPKGDVLDEVFSSGGGS